MEVNKNYIENRLNQKFKCTICGSADCVRNAYIEKCSIRSISHSTYNLMGGGAKITTTYYKFFRVCNKCGKERKRIRDLARKSHLWICVLLLISGIGCYCLSINEISLILILTSIGLFMLWRGYRDIFCKLFSATRKKPNIHLDSSTNSIGAVPQLWDFPKFIPNSCPEINYDTTFRCPKCNQLRPIKGATTIKHNIGNTYYYAGNQEVKIENLGDVRICTNCTNTYNNKKVVYKRLLIVILCLTYISVSVAISIKADEWNTLLLFFLFIIFCGIYWCVWVLIKYFLVQGLIKKNLYYCVLKNNNAVDN